ncbi:hypothetical protein ACGC1H_005238 [Rhizoctonia solani]
MPPPAMPPPAATGATGPPTASLYVGELDPSVSEAMLFEIFNMIGPVASIRICRDTVTRRSLGYAYVNYLNAADGERALDQLNYSIIKNRPCHIKWSQCDSTFRESGQGSIFVRNLDEAIDNKALHDTFAAFGNILSCKVAIDENGTSRGYAYVDYETAESAEVAVKAVNRTLLNGKLVFVGYNISRKERQSQIDEFQFTNIYIKNIDAGITEAEFKAMFEEFGTITSAVLQIDNEGKSRCFGFVNYEKHEEAERAVNEMNDKDIKGRILYVGRAQSKAERRPELVRFHEAAKQERQNKYAGANLYVNNLDDDVGDDQLRAQFEGFGTIRSCKVMHNERGISKGYGFICFSTSDEATKAVVEMNNKMVGSKPLYVSLAQRHDLRRQQLESQITQRNQMRMQQAPILGPGYIPPRGIYPPGQPMSGISVPVPYAGDMPSRGYSPQSYGHDTPPNALPGVPRPNKTGVPLPTVNAGPRSTDGYLHDKKLNDDDDDKVGANRRPSPVDESTNNQNPPPDFPSDSLITSAHPKDTWYYQPDGSGVLLVDGVLFKVQATAIFGSRPNSVVHSNRGFTPMYLEDILPRLSGSSDASPIELPGITRTQFQTYLLLITGLPYDEEYLSLLMDYLTPDKYNPELPLRYFDIMAVAPRLGMTKLEEWAINALHTIFTKSTHSFCRIPHNWRYDDFLRLRELARKTTLDSPVRAFIQYLIYKIAQDIRSNQDVGDCSSKITGLVEIYQGLKRSNDDNALLGCVFLNILSLGHRSQVWSSLTRDDKSILYAAQVQLTDLPRVFIPGSLAWLAKPDPEQAQVLCVGCRSSLSVLWNEIFGECNEGIGSTTPLKDVLFLTAMPEYFWTLWSKMNEATLGSCTSAKPLSSSRATSNTSRTVTCSLRPLLNYVDQHIQSVYEQAASQYWAIVEEF